MAITQEQVSNRRDKLVESTFHDFAPVWLVNDEYRANESSYLFNLVFYHPVHGWVNQRYKFDTFNNVLYFMGERRVSEEEILRLEEQQPFIPGNGVASVPYNPDNRL